MMTIFMMVLRKRMKKTLNTVLMARMMNIPIVMLMTKMTLLGSSGEYAAELDNMGFDDDKQTDYLDALKYCANLVWSEYLVKQKEKHPEPNNVS